MPEPSLSGLSVMIGIPEAEDALPTRTINSLLATCLELTRLSVPFEVSVISGCPIVHHARSYVGHRFLASKTNRLFMIDSDAAWNAADFVRMLELSSVMDIVCAACPAKRDPASFVLGSIPDKPNEHGCYPIQGIGLAFVVVQRKVIEALAERVPKVVFTDKTKPLPYLFRCDINYAEPVVIDGQPYPQARGEDLAFFADVREMGFGVFLDPNTVIGHIGTKMYVGNIQAAIENAVRHR